MEGREGTGTRLLDATAVVDVRDGVGADGDGALGRRPGRSARTEPLRTHASRGRRQLAAELLVPAIDGCILVAVIVVVPLLGPALGWAGALFAVVVFASLTVGAEPAPSRLTLSALDEVPRIFSRVGVALLVVIPAGLATGVERALLLQAALAAFALGFGRGCSYALIRWARRRGMLVDRAVVIGSGAVAGDVAQALREHPEFGVRVVGFVDQASRNGDSPLLGDVTDVEAIVLRHRIRRIIVAFGRRSEAELVDTLRRLALIEAEVHLVPRFFDIGVAPAGPRVDDVWGIPLYHAPRAGRHRRSWTLKRCFDVALAATCLLVALPVLAILAVAVRLSGPGGALFRQRRTGLDGREFHLLKLRSLRARDEQEGSHPPALDVADHMEVQAARRRDVERRRTRVGEFARRTCLDELPQLWNVLVGDMSLVGPRPEEVAYAQQFSETVPGYRHRHRSPVGLTGWAQVNGLRGQTSIAERARFDNHYIEHWSLWRDVVIVIRTVGELARSTLGRFGSHRELEFDTGEKESR
jgi:exopolysaccharide biosynthesis polyprenyl glycosylphosphotransferase